MSPARPVLANDDARRLFLHRHALAEPPSGPGKGTDLLDLLTRLGFVQVDSINTVARAHDMILFARRPAYRPRALRHLVDRDRTAFEHWTHDAAIIPVAFLPHWRLRFARNAETLLQRWKLWQREGFEDQIDTVLARIRARGPCSSMDVGDDEPRNSGGWWDWHPSKTALEYLWHSGRIAVTRREGFRKHYDLTERVLPGICALPAPALAETIDWACAAALDRLGFATPGELAAFLALVTPAEARDWAARARAEGRLIEIEVEGHDGTRRRSLAWPDVLSTAIAAPGPTRRLRILSPFDPALRDRARAERLFGFHYRIEVFVPAAKRKYGYYVFPMLEGDRLIGRIDMKADRGADLLHVTALWPELGVGWGKARQARLEAELARQCRLAGVRAVEFRADWLRAPR